MKSLLIVLLSVLISSPVMAGKPESYVADFDGRQITAYPTLKCSSAKIAKILKEADAGFQIKEMFKASVKFEGKKVAACAKDMGNGLTLVVGEDGLGGAVPTDSFKATTSI